ncbi:S8 family serine peptidase [Amycolatopsis taiwanensis]|uniref:S8 family serine peptidase n=1 Tax=Amycolatopsis taiwanensis TaxID=342230 RepID=UPI0004AF7E59|nr:S8 family serine peptidase [Amycolatopsis taiwanensis]
MAARVGVRLAVAIAVAANAILLAPPAASAAAACQSPEQGGGLLRETPWPQRMLAPERVAPFATGGGVTVAIVGGGVDATHPQLAGAVQAGFDFVGNKPGGNFSCVNQGTAIASIIVARQVDGIGLRGFAPGATILPVRVADREVVDNQLQRESLDPARLAAGIRWAVDHGAGVIDVSTALYTGEPELSAAAAYARDHGAVIVAPAGDNHANTPPDPVSFPAGCDGVIGVGAVDQNGNRIANSQIGSYVDIVAPGDTVTGATLFGGYAAYSGTTYAAAYVSATLALIRSAYPTLSAEEVTRRLLATASPAPGGGRGPAYGAGIVDPYRAVNETLAGQPPAAAEPLTEPTLDPAARQLAEQHESARTRAFLLAAIGVLAAVFAVVAGLCIPRGRRLRWRVGRRPEAPPRSLDDEIASGYRAPLTTEDVFTPRSVSRRN